MITTYRGIIRDGKVELQGVELPEGAEVIVVTETFSTLQEQAVRFADLSQEEWRTPFTLYRAISKNQPGEAREEDLTDETLNALVHESRTG
jgi:hypothetical protein